MKIKKTRIRRNIDKHGEITENKKISNISFEKFTKIRKNVVQKVSYDSKTRIIYLLICLDF